VRTAFFFFVRIIVAHGMRFVKPFFRKRRRSGAAGEKNFVFIRTFSPFLLTVGPDFGIITNEIILNL